MDFEQVWKESLKRTEILRLRIRQLNILDRTHVPYVMLSESEINPGDTVVRKGEVLIEKPMLLVPPNNPQFEGFDFQDIKDCQADDFVNYLVIRGVNIPSMKYNNTTQSLDIYEGRLSAAVKHYEKEFCMSENVQSGLLIGHPEFWQFSLLIYVCHQTFRDAPNDFRRLLNDLKDNNP